ncbi:MAG: efflux RND transporter periplasmic adaptor subunit [Nevskiaceae bacterium]|nr:MAG: efflux RND transporter periplasmic adaptor subunit [Nevskiaceae bacterium]
MKPYPRIASIVLLGVLLAGCGGKNADADKKEEAVVPVEAAPVVTGPIDAAYRGTATLEAEDEATVVAKTGGVIQQIFVEEGQKVRAGQPLARLDTERLQVEVARSKSSLDNLRSVHQRNESVFQRNLVSREAYDRSKADLEAGQAAYDLAVIALHDADIRAPFDGVVTARYIKLGNMIQPNAQAFRITKMDRLQASLHVPERDIHKLHPGHQVKLTVDAWPGKLFEGEVVRVNPVVDASTGTVKVTVQMKPEQPQLQPGMFARAEILYDRKDDALLIPKDAVLTEDAQQAVFVVSGDHAHRRTVRTGYSDGDHYEVIEGLKNGEQVVTTGQSNLKDDAKVQVVHPAVPPAVAAGAAAPATTAKAN